MLENILQSINSNLERIAKTQEETVKFMKEPVKISAQDIQETVKVIENTMKDAVQVEAIQAPVQVNAQVNAQVPQTPMQQTIPTTQVAESFTQEQLAVAMSNAVAAGKMNVIQGILQSFGVQALTQINPADYNKVATMLKEAGVQV